MHRHAACRLLLLTVAALAMHAAHADDWPKDAAGRLASGQAIVKVTVGPDGHGSHARILRSSGNEALDRKAMAMVEAHVFNPPVQNGVPRTVEAVIPVQLNPTGSTAVQAAAAGKP